MAYTPTKTHYGIGAVILIAIIIWAGWKYWGWFGSSNSKPANGSPCTTTAGMPGTYTNGICTDSGGPRPDAVGGPGGE